LGEIGGVRPVSLVELPFPKEAFGPEVQTGESQLAEAIAAVNRGVVYGLEGRNEVNELSEVAHDF
jgi:hypothetical protein